MPGGSGNETSHHYDVIVYVYKLRPLGMMDFCESYPIAVALVSSGSRGNRLLFYHRGQPPGHCGEGMSLQ